MDDPGTISVVVNGDAQPLPAGMGLVDLIARLGLPLQGVLVEHNGTALLRDEWPRAQLADGDRLELLRVVAGG